MQPESKHQLRQILNQCGPFETDRGLKSVFIDARIQQWKNKLPQADSIGARIDAVIDHLYGRYDDQGENALWLFLKVLQELNPPNDACYEQLETIARIIKTEMASISTDATLLPLNIIQEPVLAVLTEALQQNEAYWSLPWLKKSAVASSLAMSYLNQHLGQIGQTINKTSKMLEALDANQINNYQFRKQLLPLINETQQQMNMLLKWFQHVPEHQSSFLLHGEMTQAENVASKILQQLNPANMIQDDRKNTLKGLLNSFIIALKSVQNTLLGFIAKPNE